MVQDAGEPCHAAPVDVIDDVERGDWLAGRVHGRTSVGSVAGHGADAYVRILHPRESGHVDDRRAWGVPPSDDWTARRWSDVAAASGRTMHSLVQWGRLLDDQDPNAPGTSLGSLDPVVLAALVPLLASATSTPDDVVAGFWTGHGGIELTSRRQLDLPGREYVLASTALDELADPDWGFSLGLGWFSHVRSPSLQLLWPDDHAWVLATEIDWDSTIVGGTRALVDSIVLDGRFEAFDVGPDDDLSWDGDTLNGPGGEATA